MSVRWSRAVAIAASNGDYIDLNGPSYTLAKEPAPVGLFGAPSASVTFQPLSGDGARRGSARRDMTDVRFGVHILGPTPEAMDGLRRRLIDALATDDGSHRILVRTGDTIREAAFDVLDGLDQLAVAQSESMELTANLVGLRSPFWRDTAEYEQSWQALAAGSSGITSVGPWPIDDPGTAEAWPRWVATGPLAALTAINLSTQEAWQFAPDSPLPVGARLEVDTQEGIKTVTVDGLNAFRDISASFGHRLWPLRPGPNLVLILLDGVEPTTTVRMLWRSRHRAC